jgi:carboxyl-terminal processing protease
MQSKNLLDDQLKDGQVDLAFDIFNRFLKRLDERMTTVHEVLESPHDFTVEEEIVKDKELMKYPKTPEEAKERWRKRIKLELLNLKAEDRDKKEDEKNGKPAPKNVMTKDPIERLHRRYTSYQKRMHQTDHDELLQIFLSAIAGAYDPHTSYLSPSTLENFNIQMGLHLEGIGASLQSVDGYTVVKKVIPGGAADKEGTLEVEDKIIGVGQGESGPIEDVVDRKLDSVVDKIRGPRGTVVRLEVLAADGSGKKVISITREKIELKDSEAQSHIFKVGDKGDGTPYQVGVIDLPSFYLDMEAAQRGDRNAKSTVRDVRKIIDDFNSKEVDALVLDLRLNGGGSLQEAVALTGLFIETGPVVQVKGSETRARPLNDPDPSIAWTGPLVVMISKFSASASEIFAGAIKDYNRGIIVGDSATHGKGTVQSMIDLGNKLFSNTPTPPKLGALKLTIQRFYRPGGASPQMRGVRSHVELPSLTNHLDITEADLDYPLAFEKIESARFQQYPYVNDAIVKKLREDAEIREKDIEDFNKEIEDINLYLEQKEKKTRTLHERKFFEELDRLDASKEEKETFEDVVNSESTIELDFYLEEVLDITVDYLKLLEQQGIEFPEPSESNNPLDFLLGTG